MVQMPFMLKINIFYSPDAIYVLEWAFSIIPMPFTQITFFFFFLQNIAICAICFKISIFYSPDAIYVFKISIFYSPDAIYVLK